MPTPDLIAQLEKELRDVAILWLLTITAGGETLRLTTNWQAVTSRGELFHPYPQMGLSMPDDTDDRPPRQSLVLEDTGKEILAKLRALPQVPAPELLLEYVLETDLDTPQDAWTATVQDSSYDLGRIELEAADDELAGSGVPALTYSPALFPAMFAGD